MRLEQRQRGSNAFLHHERLVVGLIDFAFHGDRGLFLCGVGLQPLGLVIGARRPVLLHTAQRTIARLKVSDPIPFRFFAVCTTSWTFCWTSCEVD
jgi:hypothetical protein